jgi:hypothetical protein
MHGVIAVIHPETGYYRVIQLQFQMSAVSFEL